MNIRTISSVLKNKGIRYFAFRFIYEMKRKTGLMKKQFPTNVNPISLISIDEFRLEDKFFFKSREELCFEKTPNSPIKRKFQEFVDGNYTYFSSIKFNRSKNPDWVTNPETDYRYDIHKHWTEIEDIDSNAGDIKYVWEMSRFSFLYTIIRYDYHFNENHSDMVIERILDWIDANPLNCGPNYKCSQEISIRVLNWIFALYFYKNSSHLNEVVFSKILNSIYWQIRHIYSNINFSRICVRNNHAITETLTLYLTSLLLPFLPGAEKRKKNGKRWFEKEIAYQIANDGTFIQNSMNYHRVVIQLLTWAIAISDKNKEMFSDFVYDKAYKSVNFLFQCQEESNGWLPNYGANDGALFFPLSDDDYRDYRPQLDALHRALTGCCLYSDSFEDSEWYGIDNSCRKKKPQIVKQYGLITFADSGYFLVREDDTLTFIRCGLFKGIPGQADELHIDVWYKGENVLMDAGSYKYNTTSFLAKYFGGTESHNAIMIDNNDQMLKGPRFVWNNWPNINDAHLSETQDEYVFEGSVNCFTFLCEDIVHRRVIKKKKVSSEWIVEDTIVNKPNATTMRQLWHTNNNNVKFINTSENCTKYVGKFSDYYGIYQENRQIEINTKGNIIRTIIKI